MLAKEKKPSQIEFFNSLGEILSPKHLLFILANKVDWEKLITALTPLYCLNNARPEKPIRLMAGLLMRKHIRKISDETVVEQWAENNYYQYFCGEQRFQLNSPCAVSDLVHFREQIGVAGLELIFGESIRIDEGKMPRKR